TSPRSCRSTRPTTGTNGRPGTSSESSSTGTPRSRASRCPTTGTATPSARTTRWVASPWNTAVRPCPRRTNGGHTSDPPDHSHRVRPEGRHGMTVTEDYSDASGGDWDEVIEKAQSTRAERLVINMGPQHPSTHGVLRLILALVGQTCTEA